MLIRSGTITYHNEVTEMEVSCMIIVHASMNVDPAKQELFLKEIQSLVASSRNES